MKDWKAIAIGSVSGALVVFVVLSWLLPPPPDAPTPGPTSIKREGLIDQAIILDRALSPEEIQDLYDSYDGNDPNMCRHFITTSCAVVHYNDNGDMIGSCVTCNQCGKKL